MQLVFGDCKKKHKTEHLKKKENKFKKHSTKISFKIEVAVTNYRRSHLLLFLVGKTRFCLFVLPHIYGAV